MELILRRRVLGSTLSLEPTCNNHYYNTTRRTNMIIAITGATGHLGRLVINQLKAKVPATNIIALARTASKAADLGVAIREADYSKPETLDQALAGVDTLLFISSN